MSPAVRLSGAELKAMLHQQLGLTLIRELCPGGKVEGRLWSCLALGRSDKRAGSFKVYLDAARFGGFVDYGSDSKGDLIDLIALAKGTDQAGALAWARQRLGVDHAAPEKIRQVRATAKARVKSAIEDEEARLRRRRERAFAIFLKSHALLEETEATRAVRHYLVGRGIVVEQIPGLSTDVRAGMLEHWMSAEYADGRKTKPGHWGPAMICAIRDRRGLVVGVHCTWVGRDGGKALVSSPKLMLGDVAGGVIRLTNGPSRLTVEDAIGAGIVETTVLGEGVEDGLSIAMAEDLRIWAVTSLGNLGNAPLDLACVKDAIVLKDNDWDKRQAQEAFELAQERLEGHGKHIAVVSSHIGKDFNDLFL